MRYEKGRKAETRQRILEVAGRRFRRDGIDGTGLAGLMADAGLTHGGFYAHFASKDDLVHKAVMTAMIETRDFLAREAEKAQERGTDALEAMVRAYLRPLHRDHPEAGCAMAALGPEVARLDAATREELTAAIQETVALIAAHLPSPRSRAAAQKTGWAMYGLMAGTLQLARVVNDPTTSEAILRSGREAALALAQHHK